LKLKISLYFLYTHVTIFFYEGNAFANVEQGFLSSDLAASYAVFCFAVVFGK